MSHEPQKLCLGYANTPNYNKLVGNQQFERPQESKNKVNLCKFECWFLRCHKKANHNSSTAHGPEDSDRKSQLPTAKTKPAQALRAMCARHHLEQAQGTSVQCKVLSVKLGAWRAHGGYTLQCEEDIARDGFYLTKQDANSDLLAAFSQEIQLSQASSGTDSASYNAKFCPSKACKGAIHQNQHAMHQDHVHYQAMWSLVSVSKVGSRKLQLCFPLTCCICSDSPAAAAADPEPGPMQGRHLAGTHFQASQNLQYALLSFEDGQTANAICSLLATAKSLGMHMAMPLPSGMQSPDVLKHTEKLAHTSSSPNVQAAIAYHSQSERPGRHPVCVTKTPTPAAEHVDAERMHPHNSAKDKELALVASTPIRNDESPRSNAQYAREPPVAEVSTTQRSCSQS